MAGACKNPYILMIAGIFLTVVLWVGTVPALSGFLLHFADKPDESIVVSMPYYADSNAGTTRFTMQASLFYLPLQSTILRIAPDDCLTSLRINDITVVPESSFAFPLCYNNVLSADMAPYIAVGMNKITMEFTDLGGLYGANIRAMHTSLAMCLIALSAGLFFYGAFLQFRNKIPGFWETIRNPKQWLLIAGLLVFAVWGRLYFINFVSGDFSTYVGLWLRHIQRYGLLEAYGQNFSNYAPLYTYLIGIIDFFSPVYNLYTIKALTFIGDIAAAVLACHIVKKHGTKDAVSPVLAACLFLASPSGIVNGASSAQCDIFYSLFLILTTYCLFLNRPVRALLFYGVAISFKLQAVFLSPLLLVFLMRRRIAWYLIWIPAAVYVATILPCWLEGRDLMELLTIYLGQYNTYGIFGDSIYSAGNFYFLLRPGFENNQGIVIWAGLAMAVAAALVFAFATERCWDKEKTLIDYVLVSTFCVSLMPFLLPRMLDRYFYPAEIFALLLACLRPRWWIFTVLFQAASLLVYYPPNYESPLDWSFNDRHMIALVLDLSAIVGLGVLCWQRIWRKPIASGSKGL